MSLVSYTVFRELSMSNVYFVDVLLLIKKRPPPTAPKMAEVTSDEKVSLYNFLRRYKAFPYHVSNLILPVSF